MLYFQKTESRYGTGIRMALNPLDERTPQHANPRAENVYPFRVIHIFTSYDDDLRNSLRNMWAISCLSKDAPRFLPDWSFENFEQALDWLLEEAK